MGNFNLNDYETVKSRKERFYKDNKDGRTIVKNITPREELMNYALFEVKLYKDKEDQEKGLAVATGYAMEIRDKELKKSQYGKEYESVNYSSWTENCEESAVGRALDNAGYSGNKKCSREEIEKSQRMSSTIAKTPPKNAKEADFDKTLEKDLKEQIEVEIKRLEPTLDRMMYKEIIENKTGLKPTTKNFSEILNKLKQL